MQLRRFRLSTHLGGHGWKKIRTRFPELSQEDHTEFHDRFVRIHPDVILIDAKEPHRKFMERLSCDFLIHGIVPYSEPVEIRARSDVIIVKSGLSWNAEDPLSIAYKADQPEPVTDVNTLFHRLHAFRSECPGLPFLMAADRAIRKKRTSATLSTLKGRGDAAAFRRRP